MTGDQFGESYKMRLIMKVRFMRTFRKRLRRIVLSVIYEIAEPNNVAELLRCQPYKSFELFLEMALRDSSYLFQRTDADIALMLNDSSYRGVHVWKRMRHFSLTGQCLR